MAETALKFGPEWLRALSHGSNNNNNISPPPSPSPKYKLAEFRYGREEMLALYTKNMKMSDHLKEFPWIAIEKAQLPLALVPMTEDEQRMWASSVNSDGLQRITGKGGTSTTIVSRGRGGSVDRGRGRGRGSVYQRGLSFEDGDGVPGSFSRGRGNFERSQSTTDRNTRWDDRDRRFDRPYQNRVDENGLPKKDAWRGNDKLREDEGGWRSAGTRGSDKWGKGSWRNHELGREDSERGSVREGDQGFLRNGPTKSAAPYRKTASHSWDDDPEGMGDQLPEWSVENEGDTEHLGTFDASGAFMENKEEQISKEEKEASTRESEKKSKDRLKESPTRDKEEPPKKKSNETLLPRSSLPENSQVPTAEMKVTVAAAKPPEPKKSPPTIRAPEPNTRPPQGAPRAPPMIATKQPQVIHKPSEDENFALLEKAAESMMAQWTEEEEQRVSSQQPASSESVEKMAILPVHHEDAYKWFYRDPQGEIQGPFSSQEMMEWFTSGYFTMGLMVRRGCDERFAQLGELMKSWGHSPFVQGANPPPLRVSPLPTTMPQTVQPQPVDHEQQMRLMLLQQQLIHQQLLLRQHMQVQQILRQLKQQESFNALSPEQQQEVLLQQLIAQQQMHRAPAGMSEPPNMLDPLAQLQLPLLGLTLPPLLKSEGAPFWGIPTSSGNWPMGMASNKPSGSIWDVETSNIQQQQQKEEEAERKAEEARKLEEEMRRREEEEDRQRREAEERRKREEDERRRIEEEEMERRKLEEKRLEEELRRQQQEEMRRKEDEKRRLEEMRRMEQMKREEEERLKEEEKRRLELELERQQELKRQKEIERQEQQELALRMLKEQQKARAQVVVPWSNQQPVQTPVSPSLTEIQSLQEKEKEQEERQRILQEMLALQQVQQMKNPMSWAHKSSSPSPVKSLLEIQQEESEQAAKHNKILQEQHKQQNVSENNMSLRCAGIWNNAASQINWETTRGFWDDAVTSAANNRQKPAAKPNSDTNSAFPSLGNPVQTAATANSSSNSNKAKHVRAMKEKETVMKLFEAHTRSSTDDFTKWCTESLMTLSSSVDVPTFIAFLKDVESPYEVHDYVRSYLGESKEIKEFAKQFLERRSKHKNLLKVQTPEVNMWGPAPAITPSLGKTFHADSETGGGKNKKKKKNKMQKVDNSMLGFTVQANPDRINVGEIAHVEGL